MIGASDQRRYQALRQLLVEAREDAGLTQKQLAQRLKKHQSFVSKYETGERRLDVVELIRIGEVTGANIKDMLCKVIEIG